MGWRMLGWQLFRLALAIALLWWDTRIFLFYAFAILLAMRNEINYLRAFLSVNTVFDGIRFRVILSKVGATNEDLKGVGEYVRDMMMAHRPQGLKTLNEDARLLEFVDGFPWDVEWLNEGERGISDSLGFMDK